jgi:hypothetical protein
MRTTIAIISALAATVAASNVYTTVDVTITSCPPEGEIYLSRTQGNARFCANVTQSRIAQETPQNMLRLCTVPSM